MVEEKRGFLEGQVKEALAGFGEGAGCSASADETGAPLFPIQGGMDSDLVAGAALGPRLLRLAEGQPDLAARIRRRLDAIQVCFARDRTRPTRAGHRTTARDAPTTWARGSCPARWHGAARGAIRLRRSSSSRSGTSSR